MSRSAARTLYRSRLQRGPCRGCCCDLPRPATTMYLTVPQNGVCTTIVCDGYQYYDFDTTHPYSALHGRALRPVLPANKNVACQAPRSTSKLQSSKNCMPSKLIRVRGRRTILPNQSGTSSRASCIRPSSRCADLFSYPRLLTFSFFILPYMSSLRRSSTPPTLLRLHVGVCGPIQYEDSLRRTPDNTSARIVRRIQCHENQVQR